MNKSQKKNAMIFNSSHSVYELASEQAREGAIMPLCRKNAKYIRIHLAKYCRKRGHRHEI